MCALRADADRVVVGICATIAYFDVVGAGGHTNPSAKADSDIIAAIVIQERTIAASHVVAAGHVTLKRTGPVGRVAVAGPVELK